ncbi:hypothetical protein ASD39_00055 [Sphingomonas sp. Root50]|nr:hypothetical protein ASD17_06070 [Sphingomonas sp. Root1294]KQY72839.1 hypothetical protein ASD39_00055 [Sphingomonas sp. Root50]KRB88368.1 hypothetical protein ASE22_23385 [Sphingomonas sp. Root720]
MATFIITYDLIKQGQNYTDLIAKLKEYPTYWHAQGSVWIIETHQSAVAIRNNLKTCLDGNDKLIVAKLEGEAAWSGYNDNISLWLKNRLEKKAA